MDHLLKMACRSLTIAIPTHYNEEWNGLRASLKLLCCPVALKLRQLGEFQRSPANCSIWHLGCPLSLIMICAAHQNPGNCAASWIVDDHSNLRGRFGVDALKSQSLDCGSRG